MSLLFKMPKIKRDHKSSRAVVCLICRYKIFGKGRVINTGTKLIDLIRSKYKLLDNYDPQDMTLPSALCLTCASKLHNSENPNDRRSLPLLKACAYNKTEACHTRACSGASPCSICQTAREMRKKPRTPCHC